MIIKKEITALEGRILRVLENCGLGMPGPCEHGKK